MTATEQIQRFIDECLEGTDCFLVEFKAKAKNIYKIFIDADSGFTLEKCVRINRNLRKRVDESGLYPEGDYSLEVSSPGVDEPLKLIRQYQKNIGRRLEIELLDEEALGIAGKLLEVTDDKLIIEETLPKKKSKKEVEEPKKIEVKLNEIKIALVAIEF
jgi:ribosome maturation factor RimP